MKESTMRTIDISPAEMEGRVSRFRDLKPLRAAETLDIPQEAKDVIYSRELLSVIGLDDAADTPVNQGAPIQGAGGITMTHAKCPPGTGPSLHAHQQTFETFTALRDEGLIELPDTHTVVLPDLEAVHEAADAL
jgi:hypothetical protein